MKMRFLFQNKIKQNDSFQPGAKNFSSPSNIFLHFISNLELCLMEQYFLVYYKEKLTIFYIPIIDWQWVVIEDYFLEFWDALVVCLSI